MQWMQLYVKVIKQSLKKIKEVLAVPNLNSINELLGPSIFRHIVCALLLTIT